MEILFSPLKPNESYRIYTHIECDGAAPLVKVPNPNPSHNPNHPTKPCLYLNRPH